MGLTRGDIDPDDAAASRNPERADVAFNWKGCQEKAARCPAEKGLAVWGKTPLRMRSTLSSRLERSGRR
jgi:hypothetical protein